MSIQHETEQDLQVPPRASPALQNKPFPPPPHFPHPPPHARRNLWMLIGALGLTLALLASLGALFIPALLQRGGLSPTPTASVVTPLPTAPVATATPTAPVATATPTAPVATATPTAPVVTPTPTPGVVLGPRACPAPASNSAYWNALIGTIAGKRQVEGISCANMLGRPSVQAMVLVRYIADGTLDVYGFDHITANPQRIFILPGLAAGDARISGYNTILTAEADQSLAAPDLYREFQWSASRGGLVQVAFPGIYPDLTRYQAEADQVQVDAGRDGWKKDARQVALRFVQSFLDWKVPATALVTHAGGPLDVDATVRVRAELPGMPTAQKPYLTVTLSRLEGNTHHLWVVIALNQGSTLLTTIQPRSLIASPVRLAGSGSPFEGDIGEAYILDHHYTRVGQAHLTVPPGWGPRNGPYAVLVGYELSFKQGPQEGVVEVEQTNPSGLGSFAVVMVKVLLNPQARLAQGPVFCPVASLQALGIDSLQARCAAVKGNASLQALLPAGDRFVLYDQIISAHPASIWSIQSLNASISDVSTIMTDDAVADSHIYREFQWSARAGTFVQVAFPGMYPDLTRWQAQERQRQVVIGEMARVGAVETATAFIGGVGALVKGGGSRDLTAGVDVTYPPREGSLPVTRVTLSRLGGSTSGIWEVTAVGSTWLSISTPGAGATITSPVLVKGSGPQFERQIGSVSLLDQQYRQIQQGDVIAWAPGNTSPPSPFSCELTYVSSFQHGAQEGLIKLVHTSGSASGYGVVIVKVLLGS